MPIGTEPQGRFTGLPVLIPQRASETLLRSNADAVPTDDILLPISQALPNGVLQHRREDNSRIGKAGHKKPMALATYAPTRGYFFHIRLPLPRAHIRAPEGADSIPTMALGVKHGKTAKELGATVFPLSDARGSLEASLTKIAAATRG